MATFYKGVAAGTHLSGFDLRVAGLTPRSPGTNPSTSAPYQSHRAWHYGKLLHLSDPLVRSGEKLRAVGCRASERSIARVCL